MTINGTLTVSDGNLKVNGNLAFATGSTFNMSGGTIEIDGNSGISGTSVAAATPLFAFGILSGTTITTTATAGTIKITDPHFVATSSTSNGIAFQGYLGTAAAFTGTNSLVLGDQTSTDASTAVDGFKVDTYVGGARLVLIDGR